MKSPSLDQEILGLKHHSFSQGRAFYQTANNWQVTQLFIGVAIFRDF